jgi:hypothetical protein
MLKRADDDNDEVRTTMLSKNHVSATLSAEESFLRTLYFKLSPHISREVFRGGGQEIDGQCDTYMWMVPAGFSAHSQASILLNRVYNLYNYFVTRKTNKS